MVMTDYVLKNKPEPASNEMVWAFDLGHPLRLERGEDRGEVSNPVNQKTEVNPAFQFLHKASLPCRAVAQRRLVIPAEFAETKTAAGRRRMWRTRQAHKAREHWVAAEHQI
jgi:hypothetical protein